MEWIKATVIKEISFIFTGQECVYRPDPRPEPGPVFMDSVHVPVYTHLISFECLFLSFSSRVCPGSPAYPEASWET